MKVSIADAVSSVIYICGAGLLLHHTRSANYSMGDSIAFDAAWFPALLLYLMVCFAGLLGGRAAFVFFRENSKKIETTENRDSKRMLFAIGLVLSYVIAFIYFGFWIPTVLFVPTFVFVFGFKSLSIIIPVTIGFCVTIWLVFTELLELQVPAWGIL